MFLYSTVSTLKPGYGVRGCGGENEMGDVALLVEVMVGAGGSVIGVGYD